MLQDRACMLGSGACQHRERVLPSNTSIIGSSVHMATHVIDSAWTWNGVRTSQCKNEKGIEDILPIFNEQFYEICVFIRTLIIAFKKEKYISQNSCQKLGLIKTTLGNYQTSNKLLSETLPGVNLVQCQQSQ